MPLLAREPVAQRRILVGLLQRRREHRVVRVSSIWTIRIENKFGFLVGHRAPPCVVFGNGTILVRPATSSRAIAARSWALPRDSRDITVPIGTSNVSAISWYERS